MDNLRLVVWRKPLASPGEGINVGIINRSTNEVEQYRARIEYRDEESNWHSIPVHNPDESARLAAARGIVSRAKYRKTDYWRRLKDWWERTKR